MPSAHYPDSRKHAAIQVATLGCLARPHNRDVHIQASASPSYSSRRQVSLSERCPASWLWKRWSGLSGRQLANFLGVRTPIPFWVAHLTFLRGQTLGWAGMIRVDNKTYTWMGDPGPQPVNQTAFSYTSTRSTFIMDVDGKVEMNVTFLSPIWPSELVRSLTFSYLDITVMSKDGNPHNVQIYADISAGKSIPHFT